MRVSSTDLQNNFGKYLKFAEAGEEIIVTRNGKDVTKLNAIAEASENELRERAVIYHAGEERISYQDFLALTEATEQRYELIDGVVYNLASPSFHHQLIVTELHGTFYTWFKGKPCTPLTSPLDITLEVEHNNICVVQPDLVVICDQERVDDSGNYRGIPELIVEVLSPSTRSKDMIKKLDLYCVCGVKEYWIVDPMKQIVLVYSLADGDITDMTVFSNTGDTQVTSQLYPGLHVSLKELFA